MLPVSWFRSFMTKPVAKQRWHSAMMIAAGSKWESRVSGLWYLLDGRGELRPGDFRAAGYRAVLEHSLRSQIL